MLFQILDENNDGNLHSVDVLFFLLLHCTELLCKGMLIIGIIYVLKFVHERTRSTPGGMVVNANIYNLNRVHTFPCFYNIRHLFLTK